MNCAKCKNEASKSSVKCVECGSIYHATCCHIRTVAKLTSMTERAVTAWRCDECAQDTASLKSDPEDNKVTDILLAIQRDMAAQQKANKQGFTSINQQLVKLQETLADMNQKLTAVEAENAALKVECGELRAENKSLLSKVNLLENEVHDLQQYSRNRNIELKGVPLTKNEDVYEILRSVANALGITFNRHDISIAHRLPAPKDKTPSIVAQFVSRSTRADWIKAAKQKKIQTTDLSASLRPSPVFLVDHLTPQNRRLLGYAKSRVREGHLAYAWSREGNILIRKTQDSPARRVRTTTEVDFIVGPVASGGDGGGGGSGDRSKTSNTNGPSK
jgi:regulator of replication initiation timing